MTYISFWQGSTLVALYGLGNIRDERLNRMFQVIYVGTVAFQWSTFDTMVLTCLLGLSF